MEEQLLTRGRAAGPVDIVHGAPGVTSNTAPEIPVQGRTAVVRTGLVPYLLRVRAFCKSEMDASMQWTAHELNCVLDD